MNDNNGIKIKKMVKLPLIPEEVQAEVDDLYYELVRRFGAGYADSIIRRYTDIKPRYKEEQQS